MSWKNIQQKIKALDEVKAWASQAQKKGKKLVFTNGCFDLIHLGHLEYLNQARELGDLLVVGLNSDISVHKLKGEHRPIKDQHTRASLLASLLCVDAVCIFDSPTPLELIVNIKPDILCKGGDWKADQIVGGKEVLAAGGSVKSLRYLPGHSTTALETKIKLGK